MCRIDTPKINSIAWHHTTRRDFFMGGLGGTVWLKSWPDNKFEARTLGDELHEVRM